MVLRKSDIKPPVLPKETVDVPALGGEVIVRGLMLSERLTIATALTQEDKLRLVPLLLSKTVMDAEGQQVFTEAEWETFGTRYLDSAMNLFDVARRLSGMEEESLKKS